MNIAILVIDLLRLGLLVGGLIYIIKEWKKK